MACWRASTWASAVRPGLLAATRGPAKSGERAGPAGGKSRLGRSVAWATRLAPPFSLFLFFFSSPLFEFKFGLEFEFKIGVPYSLEF